jgi:hypothetical protein
MLTVTGVDKTDPWIDASMFFDINGQDYCLNRMEDHNKITVSNGHKHMDLMLDIFHNCENQIAKLNARLPARTYGITNAVDSTVSNDRIIFNDFLFNRTRAYYLQFPFRPDTKKWYNQGQLSYIIPDPVTADAKNKIYVAPNKTQGGTRTRGQSVYRSRLTELLKTKYLDQGYVGNIDDTPELFLYPHIEFPLINAIDVLENQRDAMRYSWWGYCPPHNEYYKNTFVSIYGETVEHGTSIAVTEKTYDPLIKGHFVLPFSTSGFIRHLRGLGFEFPDFIDYSYDTILNDDLRYAAYEDELRRLVTLDITAWQAHWQDNYSMIRHNQLVFHEKPYDRIDFYKLIERANT